MYPEGRFTVVDVSAYTYSFGSEETVFEPAIVDNHGYGEDSPGVEEYSAM